jgi:hypothetical protein
VLSSRRGPSNPEAVDFFNLLGSMELDVSGKSVACQPVSMGFSGGKSAARRSRYSRGTGAADQRFRNESFSW